MKIKNIHIENFKGIETLDLPFNENFTVLIGENGAGKSSILDAISIGLGTFLMNTGASFGFNGKTTRPLLKNEIRNIIVSPDNIELTDVLLSGTFEHIDKDIDWCREQDKNSKSLSYKYSSDLTRLGKTLTSDLTANVNLPLLAYHSTGRLWGEIYGKKPSYEKVGSRLDGYYACLDPRSITEKFIGWFKTYEDGILKFGKEKSLYYAFTNAITSMVPAWDKIHFNWALGDLVGQLENGNWQPLNNLSDGYKGIVSLAADIAYRAIKLNPHLGENAVTETEGIVLIDEIDMHLHPIWQKRVVEDLKRTFPKIQFIVTTHSPFIIQSLKANEIINFGKNQIDKNPNTLSFEENALFMGVEDNRSDLFMRKQKMATRYLELLKNDPSAELFTQLDGILNEILNEFSDDPVLIAKLNIERISKLGI